MPWPRILTIGGVVFVSAFLGFLFALGTHLALFEVFVTLLPAESFLSASNVLVVGLDQGSFSHRTDTILLARVEPRDKRVELVSIPRDTRIPIPGFGLDKINHAYAYGRVDLTRRALEEWLGVPIPYTVVVDLKGLVDFVDQVGGIEIDVEKPLHYVDYSQNLFIDLSPGHQKLNGQQAMGYLRYRADAGGDISRIARQQKFMRAVLSQITHKPIWGIPGAFLQLTSQFQTNLTPKQILGFAMVLRQAYEMGRMGSTTLEGYPLQLNGIFYFQVPDEKRDAVRKILMGIGS